MFCLRRLAAAKPILKLKAVQSAPKQSHTWSYRCGPPPASKKVILAAEIVGGFAWWWILWHLWTEPGHIIGEFEYPDPSKWTNEELGIPKL